MSSEKHTERKNIKMIKSTKRSKNNQHFRPSAASSSSKKWLITFFRSHTFVFFVLPFCVFIKLFKFPPAFQGGSFRNTRDTNGTTTSLLCFQIPSTPNMSFFVSPQGTVFLLNPTTFPRSPTLRRVSNSYSSSNC